MAKDKITRICLWSGPRNISTALMYSFAQRKDTTVYDEPLYAFYLRNSPAFEYHPGADEIMSSLEQDGQKVIKMMMGHHESSVVFFKNMTHHLLDLDRSFMKDTVNVLLTRDPVDMLPSFAKVVHQPVMKDVGYQDHIDLLNGLEEMGNPPIVIDSKQLQNDPERILKQLCGFAGIDFDPHMLHWEAGPRVEDGVWAKYWYDSVHRSTGFQPYQSKTEPFPEYLLPLLQECKPLYERLMKFSINVSRAGMK